MEGVNSMTANQMLIAVSKERRSLQVPSFPPSLCPFIKPFFSDSLCSLILALCITVGTDAAVFF